MGPTIGREARHEAHKVLIGKWINTRHTTKTSEAPSVLVITSDVYEWAPGGFYVLHQAYGNIGKTSVEGIEIIGVGDEGYRSRFDGSFSNVQWSRGAIDGDVIRWIGERTHCVATFTDLGLTQTAHHDVQGESGEWTASMDVTLRRIV